MDFLNDNLEQHTPDQLEKHKPEDLKPTNLPADWEQQLADKKKLTDRLAQLTAKILTPEREEVKQELTSFSQGMGLDDDDIKEKYESDAKWQQSYGKIFDHRTIIYKELTLDNKEDLKKAFKVVACICATEEVKELNKDKNSQAKLNHFLATLKEAKKGWDEVGAYQPINKENNPFYLDLIAEKWQAYQTTIDNLVKENQLQNSVVQPGK